MSWSLQCENLLGWGRSSAAQGSSHGRLWSTSCKYGENKTSVNKTDQYWWDGYSRSCLVFLIRVWILFSAVGFTAMALLVSVAAVFQWRTNIVYVHSIYCSSDSKTGRLCQCYCYTLGLLWDADRMLLFWSDRIVCCFFFLQALIFPNQLYEVVFEEELTTTSISVRLYGGALLSKSSLHRSRKACVWGRRGGKFIQLFLLPHAQLHCSHYTDYNEAPTQYYLLNNC